MINFFIYILYVHFSCHRELIRRVIHAKDNDNCLSHLANEKQWNYFIVTEALIINARVISFVHYFLRRYGDTQIFYYFLLLL